jgi:CelD/BcsL family acetyltransferase involved in cellulose biosynthesis
MKTFVAGLDHFPGWEAGNASPRSSLIENSAQLAQLAAGWQALEGDDSSPMQHFIWTRAFHEIYGNNIQLQILTSGPAHAPRAIAPLITRQALFPRLELLGVRELNEPLEILAADQTALETLAEALTRQNAGLWLERIPAESPMLAALKRAFQGRGLVHSSSAPCYPRIPLDASWVEPESHFNAGRRSDFRRAERKAAEHGAVSFEILAPTPDEIQPLLAEAYRVEAACWKGAEQSALACDEKRGAFFRRYAAAAAERGILRLCFMRLDGQAVAMQLAVECGQRFWLLKIGYDEQFARCSPGTLLMLHTLRYAAERGLRSYEFLGSSQPWTKMWTETRQHCVSLRAYPLRPGAMLTLGYDAAHHAASVFQKSLWRNRYRQETA